MSRYVKSIPSDQRTWHASRSSMGSRRKPRVLSWAHTRPEPPTRILDSQVPFWDHIDLKPSMRILNSNEVVLLVEGPNLWDENSPRGLSPLCWLQLSSKILTISKFSYVVRSSSRSNVTTPLLQCGLLCIVTNISTWQSQQSSGVIWVIIRKLHHANHTVMENRNFRAFNYNSNKYIYTSISIEKRVRYWLPPKILHTSTVSVGPILNEDSHSHARCSLAGTTSMLLTWNVFSFSVFLTGSIGIAQLCVIENPHHTFPF